MTRRVVTIDGAEACAYVALKCSEVAAIYPITPSSVMGELLDEWTSQGKKNAWGTIPLVQEMQSEAGAAGTVHGALQCGSLTTTFTSSQGLLLMIPNMYKIAGELTPAVFHVAARSLAAQALSIFGDQGDVMAARTTGFAIINSCDPQEVMDFALIAHSTTLDAKVPFIHFFDGFRTTHEIQKVEELTDEDVLQMIDQDKVLEFRKNRLSPENPVIRGTSQNPDVYFQARETVNKFYNAIPDKLQLAMDKFAKLTGRQYHLYDYYGAKDAQRVLVVMGSGAGTIMDTVDKLNEAGEKVGVIKAHLFRPFSIKDFIQAFPKTVKVITALDRTKEPGSSGEPLYLDVVNAVMETMDDGHFNTLPKVTGGRYGLSSKEFTPAMVKGIYDEMKKAKPKNHFTIGINDDVSHTSLDYDPEYIIEEDNTVRGIFYGLGSDGTVGANKNTIKIIGAETDNHVQGYFVYDSKKAGSVTISHLRFGPNPIRGTYLINKASFVGCHQFEFICKYEDILDKIETGGVFLLNAPCSKDEVWDRLPTKVQKIMIDKKVKFFAVDAYKVARENGMGVRINTVMQTCFFAISGILPRKEAIASIKRSIEKAYSKKGAEVIQKNFDAVDDTLVNLHEIKTPSVVSSKIEMIRPISKKAPEFVQRVTARMIARQGDLLPVSALPADGTYPVGTTAWEKRNLAQEIPVWEPDMCIQCGKCIAVCPHSVIRTKAYENNVLDKAPETFKHIECKDKEFDGLNFTIQIAPEDCTGCAVCVDICPVKSKTEDNFKAINMRPQRPIRDEEIKNWDFFLNIPELERSRIKRSIRGVQYLEPLFEFSGACAGCGETPYLKMVTQLYGDRAVVANATGCSSIYGGNLPTTPWTKNKEGRGPAWANSLFEDNAEFGLGFRLSIDKQAQYAAELVKKLESIIGTSLAEEILNAVQIDEADIYSQRNRVEVLKKKLKGQKSSDAVNLLSVADMLVKKSVWIIGGDGWAYDIGYGGLDHVIAGNHNVNILVLDTEVYSNTGGQASKSTPLGAVAKFAASGKPVAKKDLARMAMTYGHAYVAQVALGAKDEHTIKAFIEAERYQGVSLIIAYSPCIAHGINMTTCFSNMKLMVDSGYWPLFRYNPDLRKEGKSPLVLDSKDPKVDFSVYAETENRFQILKKSKPEEAKRLLDLAQQGILSRWEMYKELALTGAKKNTEEK